MPTDSAILATLADDFLARLRRGEQPAIEEYATAHSALADRIRQLFPTLMMLEGLAAHPDRTADHLPVEPGADIAGRPFGPYRLIREIGRGGMGVVYEAEHEGLRRRVALKLLAVSGPSAGQRLERFFREAQIAAGLHHTNIVPVFDVGQVGGRPYYAMQYIRGKSLEMTKTSSICACAPRRMSMRRGTGARWANFRCAGRSSPAPTIRCR
jgi:serine/threonine protein kinase